MTLHSIPIRYYRPQLFQCPLCSSEQYRSRGWVPAEKPLYKGHEDGLPVICGAWRELGGIQIECPGRMEPVLKGIGCDLLPDSFVIGDIDGKGERRVSSLAEIRTIERESEKQFRDGVGQPLVFRDLSQDRGNTRTNVFSGASYEKGKSLPPPKRRTVSGQPISIRPFKE